MIEVDGGMQEGGGQILRTALSVACVLQKPVRITNIRAGRSEPGLKPQHLAACKLLAQITGGKMLHAEAGSSTIEFFPGKIRGGEFSFGIGTAGSITLMLQAALPVLAHADEESRLEVSGGTHVAFSPTFDYFAEVFLPAAREFGLKAKARMLAAGFYPKGGGRVELVVQPSRLKGRFFEAQKPAQARYRIISSGLPPHVAQRERQELEELLRAYSPRGEAELLPSLCAGNAITVWSGFIGASSLGQRGKPAEKVAGEAAGALLSEIRQLAAVDSRLADQLLVYAALAEGKSGYATSALSSHCRTNAAVLSQLTGRNIILAGERQVLVE